MVATLLCVDADCNEICMFHANREASPMASYFRSMLPLAAVVVAAGMLSIASPVSAAGPATGSGEAMDANAASTATDLRNRASQRLRLAASRDHRRERYVRSNTDCSGAWCRRQFVLMIGIAY